jgi:hypothetical protein
MVLMIIKKKYHVLMLHVEKYDLSVFDAYAFFQQTIY